jgi:hypothetical protein
MARYRLSLFDLGDVIRTLRAITGSGDNGFDADGDGKTGLSDAIILLQKIGAMR